MAQIPRASPAHGTIHCRPRPLSPQWQPTTLPTLVGRATTQFDSPPPPQRRRLMQRTRVVPAAPGVVSVSSRQQQRIMQPHCPGTNGAAWRVLGKRRGPGKGSALQVSSPMAAARLVGMHTSACAIRGPQAAHHPIAESSRPQQPQPPGSAAAARRLGELSSERRSAAQPRLRAAPARMWHRAARGRFSQPGVRRPARHSRSARTPHPRRDPHRGVPPLPEPQPFN